jgi:hypothetical protein
VPQPGERIFLMPLGEGVVPIYGEKNERAAEERGD